MSDIHNMSRRSFVKNIGLASGGLILAGSTYLYFDKKKPENKIEFNPNLFVQLNSDGSLILIASRSEMGNGVRTSLTSVIADEMDADWNKVTVKQAMGDIKYGDQNIQSAVHEHADATDRLQRRYFCGRFSSRRTDGCCTFGNGQQKGNQF